MADDGKPCGKIHNSQQQKRPGRRGAVQDATVHATADAGARGSLSGSRSRSACDLCIVFRGVLPGIPGAGPYCGTHTPGVDGSTPSIDA